MTPLQETIQAACGRMMEYLQEKQEASSWQLKLALHLSSSVLYLSLGVLLNQGKIRLEADGINYKVSLPQPDLPPQQSF
ncbi:hypothetical protein [Candidatus Avelusimicrobium facis]|uniref:hypothetical protein n=1 Tax=Candidatus Avelusimicrobium facis TaxID=3416203 RepID=UPI0015B537BA